MKDRTGECWFMPSQKDDASNLLTEQFLVIVSSEEKKNYFVHTFVSTHADGKFEFRTMREWSQVSLETYQYKRVG